MPIIPQPIDDVQALKPPKNARYGNALDEGYVDGDIDIQKMIANSYEETISILQSWQQEADLDERFVLNDQSVYGQYYQNLTNAGDMQFNFNLLLRNRNMVVGHQSRNRKSLQALPVEGSDQLTADQWTKLFSNVYNSADLHQFTTDAFSAAVTTGLGAIELWLDPSSDPINPDIKASLKGYSSFLFDPYFRLRSMEDSNFIWTRRYITAQECKSLMPDRDEEINYLSQQGFTDQRFQFMAESYNINTKGLCAYDEYWHLHKREAEFLIDLESGERMEWKGKDKDMLKRFLANYPQIRLKKLTVPSVRLAIMINGRVLYKGNPYNIDKYPIIPLLGYFDPNAPSIPLKMQGIIRSARDLQFLFNRRMKITLDAMESVATTGKVIMEGSLVNPQDALQTGQGRALFVKANAPQGMNSIAPMPPPNIPQSFFEITSDLQSLLPAITGVNEELFGTDQGGDKVGIVEKLRQSAGITTLYNFFDNADYAQKLLGSRIMELVENNWDDSKIRRILGEEPTPQFKNKAFQKYSLVLAEGFLSDTQRQLAFAQLVALRELVGDIITAEDLLELATIQDKDALIEKVKARQEQASQMQQMQMQSQMKEAEARTGLAEARAVADKGLGIERLSRVEENKQLAVERSAEAKENLAEAKLKQVKMLKELEQLDMTTLQTLIKFLQEMQKENRGEEGEQ